MLIVLASIADQYVTTGAAHLRTLGMPTEIVTCHDLAQPGWKLSLDGDPTLVVKGKLLPAKELNAVITRISGVTPFELPFVHVDDREYAAAEMQAFLLALLEQIRCPVLNRPTPGCLCGPSWSIEQWTQCAAHVGVPVRPARRAAYAGGAAIVAEPAVTRTVVHVVGDAAFGDPDPELRKAAIAIARAAGMDLLRVAFDRETTPATFIDADAWVDISDIAIADAIRRKVAS